ncbi:gephyrin-like molybdotransferase Glp [Mitsuaria sp. GD03876]|uniref:molybdopterin molybdotransferase MoeA n=1 Tax=Mitsuaria sp. GD03876 TaxID=2975399 RepID=UPI00244B3515|nr:gephyrin-like molybdotransferase Glp [Mitsuaria sp. GD03876]MDH0866181.1 molybdopterin molybdotransferase MoeA [Mitsuaria sp. GD03876]
MSDTTPAPGGPTPRAPMLPMEEAIERLLSQVTSLGRTESVATPLARGRVLARDLVSPLDVPPYDNSAMDGYAMRAADVAALGGEGAVLPVSQRVPAGSVPGPLQPGTAARIFTGATVPDGADTVLMQEVCEAIPDAAGASLGQVRIHAPLTPGLHIRRRGEDLRVGQPVLAAGSRLNAASLGLAATAGAAALTVAAKPRVALFSTGDELVLPGEPLGPGQIYNSNRTTLHALLLAMGCEVRDLGIVPDSLEATRAALREAAKDADLILSSGGVSVGEEDHLKPALEHEGRLDLWQIAIKPGKPLAFGEVTSVGGRTWFMGLPGNPVSSFVTFLLFVRPVLLRMQGATQLAPRGFLLPAEFTWTKADKRREFLRAKLSDAGGLQLFGNQSSGVMSSAAWADGLIDLPPGSTVEPGQVLRFLPFNDLF